MRITIPVLSPSLDDDRSAPVIKRQNGDQGVVGGQIQTADSVLSPMRITDEMGHQTPYDPTQEQNQAIATGLLRVKTKRVEDDGDEAWDFAGRV